MLRLLYIFALSFLVYACSDNSDPSGAPSAQTGQQATQNDQESIPTDQEQFLIDNAAREEVIVTQSGLQYEVLRSAESAQPTENSIVTVHYRGTITDGTEFDSSYARGEPNTFPLSGTIPGWVEGVQLMSVGSQFRFFIPPTLAYADTGVPGTVIAPGAVLVFEIELLEINSGGA